MVKRVTIGGTGIEVHRLGFGGIPIQRVSEAQAVETVLHAINRGIDFIDTSRAYTTSERRIGLALRQTSRRVVLASKSPNKTAAGARADLATSLRELGRETIDLYQVHFVKDVAEYQKVISPGGALEGLRQAQREGRIGHIGLTSHSLEVLDLAVDSGLFVTIMVCFSFLEPLAAEKLIPKARANKVGLLAMKPFSGGVIENARLALKYALSQPEVLVVAGVESKALIDENWEIFQNGAMLTADEEKEIEAIRRAYDKAFCRRCDYCQPCSEKIPIQAILGLRSMVKRMGKQILQGNQKEAIETARNCTGCKECTTRCPYRLPIPDLIRENIAWADEQLK